MHYLTRQNDNLQRSLAVFTATTASGVVSFMSDIHGY